MTGLDKAVALFVGVAVASLAWAELRDYAVTELRQMVLEPAIVYLILRTTPFERRSQWRLVDMMVLAATIAAGIGLYRYTMGIRLNLAEGGTPRLDGIFMTPNVAALHLGRVLPVAFAVMLMAKGRPYRRWLYGAAGVVMLVAAVLTLSKGGLLLGIPAALAVVVILWLGRAGVLIVLGGIVAEVLALIPLSQHPRFSTLLDFTSGSSFFRLQLWQSTLRMIRDHPILGVGLDQFLYQYRSRYILPEAWQEPDLNQPHNVLLNYWVRLGIFGLIAGVWMQVAFWRLAYHTQKRLRDVEPALFALVAGFMGSMADFLAHGMVDGVHFVVDLAFIFYLSLGLVHQLSEVPTPVPTPRQRRGQPDREGPDRPR
jgi:putative inorganic carbon (HCO3(-)) transporter